MAAVFAPLQADTVVIDFEGLSDGTSLASQYPGITFSNATILVAGISLNEFEFPPHSGTNVIFDDGGPISISFASPVLSFGAYFTYSGPLTIAGFDTLNNEIATASSVYSSSDALYGDAGSSPNEFLQVAFTSGISSFTIIGDPAGSSFVMDDATLTTSTAMPEPGTAFLLLAPAVLLIVFNIYKSPKNLVIDEASSHNNLAFVVYRHRGVVRPAGAHHFSCRISDRKQSTSTDASQ